MNYFEQFMFEELEDLYASENLKESDYKEIFERFIHLKHIPEVKPYLWAMRFLGEGTKAEPEKVLGEIEDLLPSEEFQIRGLYADMRLISGIGNDQDWEELEKCILEGYDGKFLKKYSQVHLRSRSNNEENSSEFSKEETDDEREVCYINMIFEGNGYSGFSFTSGDVDYLNAKVFIEPMKTTHTVSVSSQIFDGDQPFSDVFEDECDLEPGDTYFQTSGWGSDQYYAYENKVYQWRIKLDGKETYSQKFRFYNGKIKREWVSVNDIKLFASKASGALEADRDRYSTAFKGEEMEYLYFKLFINALGEEAVIQIFLKIMCLEDNTVFYDNYFLQPLNASTYAFWKGVGFAQKGQWKKGLYKYTIRVGTGNTHEGLFSVY